MLRIGALVLAVVAVSGVAQAEVVWRGDFETGNLSQYDSTQMVSADRLQVVSTDAREGAYALMTIVKQGDDPINASGNRNELVYQSNEQEGSEYFYKWSTKFDETYPSSSTWQLFAQWHHSGCCGSPPIQFVVKGEQMSLEVGPEGKTVWTSPLVRGQWRDFVFHVKWSADASVGYVELYLDGEKVLERTSAQTMFPGDGVYLKVGLYRNETIGPVGIVYHDGWMMATELEDVMPPPEVATGPTPTPTPTIEENGNPSGSGFPGTVIVTPSQHPGEFDPQAAGCAGSTTGLGGLWPLASLPLALLWRRRRSK
jgi:uncharacterized protein (TIGR03382 family)